MKNPLFTERLKYVKPHNYVKMGNITLSIPEEVHKQMKRFSDIRWSEVARQAIIKKIEMIALAEKAEKLAKKSKLTEKDVQEFSKKINAAAAKRFLHDIGRL